MNKPQCYLLFRDDAKKKCPAWLAGQTSEAKEEGCEPLVCNALAAVFKLIFRGFPRNQAVTSADHN